MFKNFNLEAFGRIQLRAKIVHKIFFATYMNKNCARFFVVVMFYLLYTETTHKNTHTHPSINLFSSILLTLYSIVYSGGVHTPNDHIYIYLPYCPHMAFNVCRYIYNYICI